MMSYFFCMRYARLWHPGSQVHMVSDINISKSSAWLYMSWSSLYPLCTVEDECYILLTKVNFVLVRYTRMQPWLIISSAVGDAVFGWFIAISLWYNLKEHRNIRADIQHHDYIFLYYILERKHLQVDRHVPQDLPNLTRMTRRKVSSSFRTESEP